MSTSARVSTRDIRVHPDVLWFCGKIAEGNDYPWYACWAVCASIVGTVDAQDVAEASAIWLQGWITSWQDRHQKTAPAALVSLSDGRYMTWCPATVQIFKGLHGPTAFDRDCEFDIGDAKPLRNRPEFKMSAEPPPDEPLPS